MKRFGNLWHQLVSFENLLTAWKKAKRGKTSRFEVARFSFDLERQLFNIQNALKKQTYQSGAYRVFTLYERKPRLISAAPFRDRVVHHALINVVEPLIDKKFIYDSFACRRKKGVHLAVDRYQQWSTRYAYALKLDISRYFPSIDHAIVMNQLESQLKDERVLWLFAEILQGSPLFPDEFSTSLSLQKLAGTPQRRCGLPIGNLTSQFLANLYLNELDHFIKQKLRVKAYLRYVDDMILLADDKKQLHQWRLEIEHQLTELGLQLHPRKVNIFRVIDGVDVLGYRVFPTYRLLRNDNGFRFTRKLKGFALAYNEGRLSRSDINPSVQSWIGHASQADTLGLRKSIFNGIVFTREQGIHK